MARSQRFSFGLIVLALLSWAPHLAAQTRTVVLDNFEVDPYTHFNPDSSDTVVEFPTTTWPPDDTSANWAWTYFGYGTPAAGNRDTTTFLGVASWHFFLRQASNLDDPDASDDLSAAGPIVATIFNNGGFEARTFDQVLADLGQPPIDWSQVVRFAVKVRAKWDTNASLGTFDLIRQGILVQSYSTGVQNVADFTYGPGDNDDGWHEATIEVVGEDSNDSFVFGLFGRADFDADGNSNAGASLGDQQPALDFWFDDLRVLYTPLRLANVAATSPVDENGSTTLSGDVVYTNAATTFDVDVDWGDGSPVETFTYPAGTQSFSETHQYLDDDPTATPSDVVPVTVTLRDDEGSGTASTSVEVDNVAPVLSNVAVQFDPGFHVQLAGDIADPGSLDTFTLQVDWGDGAEVFNYPAGTTGFSQGHTYADATPHTILLTLVDDDTGTDEAQAGVVWPVLVIPTLSGLGLLALAALLAAAGLRRGRARRRA